MKKVKPIVADSRYGLAEPGTLFWIFNSDCGIHLDIQGRALNIKEGEMHER